MNFPAPQTIAVIDYGMGNLRSVAQAAQRAAQDLPVRIVVTHEAQAVRQAHRLILPGQGAMGDCMAALRQSGLQEAVLHAAAHKPLLGICVGLQMLLEHSAEGHSSAGTPGLGLLPGEVVKFELAGRHAPDGSPLKVPHMGWNLVHPAQPAHPMWQGVPEQGAWFYFVHSYYARPALVQDTAAHTTYGPVRFASAVARGSLFATQFHPEKSADQGLRLFRNFLRWQP